MIINHIDLPYGFNVGSREPIDARFILSKADMAKVGDATQGDEYALPRWPEHYFVLCEDDGQIYEFHQDATAPNGCVFTRVTFKIDNKTVLENANLELYVPIDEQTIVVNSEGKLVAVPEQLIDGVATEAVNLPDGTAKVNVVYDPATLVVALNNELGVKFDHDTIKVGSEGLYVDFDLLPDNVTIKMNSEGKLEAQYKADEEKGLKLDGVKFEVKVDNDTIKFDSEGKLMADFIRYVGSEGIAVEDEVIKAVVDGETIKVVSGALEVQAKEAVGKDSEGLFVKHDAHSVVLNANDELRVPLASLVHEDSEHVIKVVEGPADELTLKLGHDDTLVVTSEGKLHVVARQAVASEGIIVVPEGETSIISADFDHKTIILGSDGMEVNIYPKHGLKLAEGAGGAPLGLKVDVDGVTVNYDSEGRLVSTSTPLEVRKPLKKQTAADGTIILDIGYDKKTIKLDNSELYVPIDEDSIIISEGLVKAKKQLFADAETIIEDSEHVLHANIDNKTIIYNPANAAIETAIGGWKEAQTHKTYLNQTYNGVAPIFVNTGGTIFEGEVDFAFAEVPLDSALVDVALALKVGTSDVLNKTFSNYSVVDYGNTIEITGDPSDELVNLVYDKTTGKAKIKLDVASVTVRNNLPLVDTVVGLIEGDAANYHTVDPFFIPVDNQSIVIKGGKLVTSAPSITAGDGLEYEITPTANILKVLVDSESLGIRGDNLYVPVLSDHTPAEEDLVLTINSEGKPEFLRRAGVVDVLIDSESMVADYIAVIPDATTLKRGVVKFDGDTLVLNSEGQLKVVNLVEDVFVKELVAGSEVEASVVDSERHAHIDLTPYSKLDETGYRIRLLVDGHEAPSEGVYDSESEYKVTAELYDQAGNLLTTSNVLDLPLEKVIVNVTSRSIPTSEGTSETTLIFHFMDESTVEIPLAAIVSGFITIHGDYVGMNSIYGTKNFEGELMNYGHEVVTQVQFDNKTVRWNDSEVYVEALLPEGRKAIELVDLGASYVYDVKYDDLTVKVNSENELFVPIDEKTIVLEGGKVVANIDKRTIVYDVSEGHIELPIDEVTIFVNSEGRLEAAGMDVKPGEAIKISTSEEAGLPVKYIDVLYDDSTIILDSEGKLTANIDKDSIILDSEGKLAVDQYTVAEIKALWHAICLEGEA